MRHPPLSPATTAAVSFATALVCILAIILIVLFFLRGGLFGTLNDIANALVGLGSGFLAWMLFTQFPPGSRVLGLLAFAVAVLGAGVVVLGTELVIFHITSWVLAGWYTAVGNALIGIWLAAFSYFAQREMTLPGGLASFGLVTGLLMAVGFIALLGILLRTDSMASMPWILNLSYVGFFGTYILFPIWAIWLGGNLLTK